MLVLFYIAPHLTLFTVADFLALSMFLTPESDKAQYFTTGGAFRCVFLQDLRLCRGFALCLCLALKASRGLGLRGYQGFNLGAAGASGVG